MDMSLIQRIQGVSLKWKLLIPFLLFAFCGTTILSYIGLTSQQELIKSEERKELVTLYRAFTYLLDNRREQALSIATLIAQNMEVQQMMAHKNRTALITRMLPLYEELRSDFGILQLHFHVPPGRSFLRVHKPEEFGDSLAYRKSILEVYKTGERVGGLESGITGLGIRGVAPIFSEGRQVGSVEVGYPLDRAFLTHLKHYWGSDYTVFAVEQDAIKECLSTTISEPGSIALPEEKLEAVIQAPRILIAPPSHPDSSILHGIVKNYSAEAVALVKIMVNRSGIQRRLSQTKHLMILVGTVGILVSFALTWLVASLFIRPIQEIVQEAQDIAEGKRESRLLPKPADEIGVLTQSLNTMLQALKERRMKIQEYANTLESKVQERTADLIASEEKYRTLVESLPLIVYRLLDDGTTEFINPFFTETLGYTPDEVVGNKRFWREKICGSIDPAEENILDACWGDAAEMRMERSIQDRRGHWHTFIDRAIPSRYDDGRLRWIDGIMIDITEFKRLQEKALQTEEIRILGEISARLAHEIRNPLATAGGFARRLRDTLPQDEPRHKFAAIIVDEVARLEEILKIILSSIQPITLELAEVDLRRVLESCLDELRERIDEKEVDPVTSISPTPVIQGDENLLHRAFANLLQNAVFSMPRQNRLELETRPANDQVIVNLRYKVEYLSDEDLEQFFLPRLAPESAPSILELPLSRIIILRHGGNVEVSREGRNRVALRVALPLQVLGTASV
jgi:PAS domain S-box-containing protein